MAITAQALILNFGAAAGRSINANMFSTRTIPGFPHVSRLIKRLRIRYCRGVYSSFNAASNAIPSARLAGYDNKECSEMYLGSLDYVKPSDYAGFHWLGELLANSKALFDLGGNVGWSYFAYQKYLLYPSDLRWIVCDVPAVVETGRALAAKRGAQQLRFTTDFQLADNADILLTNGALQYINRELPEMLAELPNKPRHLLINRVPFSEAPTFYTVQDIGTACCAYRISNRARFVAGLQSLGYERVDSWRCCESSCRILFHPRRTLRHYLGMYFRLDDSARCGNLNPAERRNAQATCQESQRQDRGAVWVRDSSKIAAK